MEEWIILRGKYITIMGSLIGFIFSSFLLFFLSCFLCKGPMKHHPLLHPSSHLFIHLGWIILLIVFIFYLVFENNKKNIFSTLIFSILFGIPTTFVWISVLWSIGNYIKQFFSEEILLELSKFIKYIDRPFYNLTSKEILIILGLEFFLLLILAIRKNEN